MVGDMSDYRKSSPLQTSVQTLVTIPGHPGDDLPIGTLKSILKAAGLEAK